MCFVPLKSNLQEVELLLFHLQVVQIAQNVGTYSVKQRLFNFLNSGNSFRELMIKLEILTAKAVMSLSFDFDS